MGILEYIGTAVKEHTVEQWIYLVAALVYLTISVSAILLIFIINNRLKKSKIHDVGVRGIYGVYIAASLFALNSFILRITLYVTNGKYSLFYLPKAFIYVSGWAVIFYSVNFLVLNVVALSKSKKRNIKLLMYVELFIALGGLVYSILCNVPGLKGIAFEKMDFFAFNNLILGDLAILGTTIIILAESRKNPSTMQRMRLKLIGTGTLAITIDIAGIAFTILLLLLEKYSFLAIWHQMILPVISIVTNVYFMFAFYFSIFTPLWLQKMFKVIPPSFYEMMSKKESLNKK